jgi:hypothetical protein
LTNLAGIATAARLTVSSVRFSWHIHKFYRALEKENEVILVLSKQKDHSSLWKFDSPEAPSNRRAGGGPAVPQRCLCGLFCKPFLSILAEVSGPNHTWSTQHSAGVGPLINKPFCKMTKNEFGTGNRPRPLSVISKNGMTYRSSISSTDANAKIGQEMQSVLPTAHLAANTRIGIALQIVAFGNCLGKIRLGYHFRESSLVQKACVYCRLFDY